MNRTNLFFKVEIEHDDKDKPERLAEEIRRRISKIYGVRTAEISSITRAEE